MKGPRYSIIPRAAVVDARLEGRDLQVLALLGSHTDNDGWCSRSQVKMARELGCGRATVQRSLVRLIECGYVDHRPLLRDDGGDRAHEYRVLLDEIRPGAFINETDGSAEVATVATEASGEAASAPPPCPPVGTPLPTSGQGVPTYERAPIRTTLLKRDERETRARRDPEAERRAAIDAAQSDGAFMAWFAGWPTSSSDDIIRTHRARLGLSAEEWTEAVANSKAAVAHHQVTLKRTGCYAAFTYLEQRRWKTLPAPASGAHGERGGSVTVPARSQAWFAIFFRRWRAGDRVKVMFETMQRGVGYSTLPEGIPSEADLAALVKIEAMRDGKLTEEMAAWRDALASAGVSFTPAELRMPFVWVPSRWPPGTREDPPNAGEYFGDEWRL